MLQRRAKEMARWGKSAVKHKVCNLNPQQLHENLGVVV